jgi:hypothetical protein
VTELDVVTVDELELNGDGERALVDEPVGEAVVLKEAAAEAEANNEGAGDRDGAGDCDPAELGEAVELRDNNGVALLVKEVDIVPELELDLDRVALGDVEAVAEGVGSTHASTSAFHS